VEYATDEERVEELKDWWKENGKSVIFGLILGLSILFGWRWWGNYQLGQSLQASTLYTQLVMAIKENKTEQAQAISDELFKKYSSRPYSVYAALALAKIKVEANDFASAKMHLQWASEHASTPELERLASLRLARVLSVLGEYDKAYAIVNSADSGNYISMYEELKGDILAKQGKPDKALLSYRIAIRALPAGSSGVPGLQFKIDDLAK